MKYKEPKAKAKLIDKTIWCNRGHLPVHYSFCPSEAAWGREMKRLKIPNPIPYPDSAGRCTHFEPTKGKDEEGHRECVIVTVAHDPKASGGDYVGVLVHEGLHVFQAMCRVIGEEAPSPEFAAYTMQAIITELMHAFEKTRGRIVTRRVIK